MIKKVQEAILYAGLLYTVIWIILIFLGIFEFWETILIEIPGVILLWIGLYNWRAGENLSHKQKLPIENI